jgi:hypothetical protein
MSDSQMPVLLLTSSITSQVQQYNAQPPLPPQIPDQRNHSRMMVVVKDRTAGTNQQQQKNGTRMTKTKKKTKEDHTTYDGNRQ